MPAQKHNFNIFNFTNNRSNKEFTSNFTLSNNKANLKYRPGKTRKRKASYSNVKIKALD